MNVSLTPELEKFIADKVGSGLYTSASEVIREGLRLLREHDEIRQRQIAEVRAKIDRGIEQLERGKRIPGHQVREELRKLSAERRRKGA